MIECLDEETAGAAGRIKDRFSEARISDCDHEAHDRTRGVELAGIPRRIAHFPQHGFVERAEGMELFA